MPPAIPIADPQDPRLAEYRAINEPALAVAGQYFVAEGRFVVERLIDAPGYRLRSVLVTETSRRAIEPALSRLPLETPVYVADRSMFEAIAGYPIHRGCLALANRPTPPALLNVIHGSRAVVVLEGCGNPDNLGGIFRNCAAFGVDAVLLSPTSVDPLYRKSIRTSMAAVFSVPFVKASTWPDPMRMLMSDGFTLVALTPRQPSMTLEAFVTGGVPDRIALLVGSEGDGLSPEALSCADVRVRVPIAAAVDSLNVAVATGIALSRLSLTPLSDTT